MTAAARPLVALAGNPNVGKTTLFNVLTGSRARVGNYPGITVERRMGTARLPDGNTVDVLDVPGTYSLVARTAEELIAIEALLGITPGFTRPDVVVLCVDSTQLVRSLYLVLQAQELGLPVIVALTMTDEAKGAAPDPERLARVLDCPVIPVVAPKGHGIDALMAAVAQKLRGDQEPREIWRWQPTPGLRETIDQVRAALPVGWPRSDALALWAMMSLEPDNELGQIPPTLRAAAAMTADQGGKIDDEAIRARYAWLDATVAPLVTEAPDRSRTERVDRVLIHPVAGLFVFLGIMFVIFQALFAWTEPVIGFIETAFSGFGDLVTRALPAGLLADFFSQGLIAGVGAVVVFLPQILLLFLFLGLLEDSGYMARVAYLMDRIMRAMNLHGRAFVPILSGFACAVPAIMATRTMERQRDRILTMMVVPLTTCSARLPVYTLIIAALFANHRIAGLPAGGFLMVFMYAFGIVTALVAAFVLSRVIKPLKARRLPFVIELPPYRLPRLRDVVLMMFQRSSHFLREAGTIIVACTVVLWFLLSFPREATPPVDHAATEVTTVSTSDRAEVTPQQQASERLHQSYAGRLGRIIEPAIEPLGFDWKIGIGLIGAFAAREVFVATMGVVYGIGEDADEDNLSLREKLREEQRADGSRLYTPLVGLTLMIFFALSCQCVSTLAVVRRETASFRWPVFLFAYMTVLAWVVSFGVYQTGRALGLG